MAISPICRRKEWVTTALSLLLMPMPCRRVSFRHHMLLVLRCRFNVVLVVVFPSLNGLLLLLLLTVVAIFALPPIHFTFYSHHPYLLILYLPNTQRSHTHTHPHSSPVRSSIARGKCGWPEKTTRTSIPMLPRALFLAAILDDCTSI